MIYRKIKYIDNASYSVKQGNKDNKIRKLGLWNKTWFYAKSFWLLYFKDDETEWSLTVPPYSLEMTRNIFMK